MVPLPPFSSPDSDVDAPPHIHNLANEIIHLNLIELAALMDRIGDHFGFDDSDAFGAGDSEDSSAGGAGGEEVVEEKTIFDLKLEGFDAKAKIKVIKEVRTVTGLGLKEAKELVEGAPVSDRQISLMLLLWMCVVVVEEYAGPANRGMKLSTILGPFIPSKIKTNYPYWR